MSPDEHILVLEREVAALRQWKAEAMQVLSEWERVWEAAGRPGRLGFSKAAAVQALIADLRATEANVRAALTPDEVDEVGVMADIDPPDDLPYDAWVLLANGAYWDHTDPKGSVTWNAARDRWRDRWHATLPSIADEVDEVQP